MRSIAQHSVASAIVRDAAFYLGIALLFTHELDAMPNHEWRMIPVLRAFSDPVGQTAFLLAHVPLFAAAIAFIASLNPHTRALARAIASGFLIFHAAAHVLFSGQAAYEFSSVISASLIYGAALCGIGYFVAQKIHGKPDSIR
ncbi:MAG: hypothetical protein OEM51_03665 [Gammaproteobacteria bacterium]|nr:hypothetical protein [Gammaproteobacteria bacterium]